MTRNGGVRPAEKAAQEEKEKEDAGVAAEKMELGDEDDEEYYPSGARPAEKGELLLSRTLALRCPKGFAFIKSSEFEQFKENWQEMKGRKKSHGSMMNGGVDPMSWRSGIFDRHKVAEPYSGGGGHAAAAPVAPVAPVPKPEQSAPPEPPAKQEVDPAILQKVESIIATPVLEIPLAGGDKTDEECTEEELAERKKQRKAMKKREKELAKQELKKKLEEIAIAKRRVEEVERQKKEAAERKQEQLRASGGVFNQYDNMFNDMLPPPDAYSARRPDPYANRTVKPASMSLGSDRSHKRMRDGRIIKNRRMLREAQIEDERQKRRNVLIKSCRDVLNYVKRNKFHWIFTQPVDAVKLGIPDYYEIVKNPMDLGKVKEKLDGKKYTWPTDFADDMRLIFDNCALYNGTTTDAGEMGETVRGAFEEGWVKYNVEQKMSDEEDIRTKEDIEIANTPEDPIRQEEVFAEEQAKLLSEMKRELAELRRQKGGGGGYAPRERDMDGFLDDDFDANMYDDDPEEYAAASRGKATGKPRGRPVGSGSGQPKAKRQRATPQSKVTKDRKYIELDQEPLPTREMTFDEKHALTMSLQELPESKQEMVITIVQEGQAAMGKAEGDEIEINIEELDSKTLWRLQRYCDSQLRPKKSKKSASAMDLVKEAKAREAAAMRELEACEANLKNNPRRKASNTDLATVAGASGEKPANSDSSDSDSDSDSDSSSSEGGDSNPEKGNKAAGSGGNDDGTSNVRPVSRVEQSTNQLLQPAVDELGIKRDQKQPVAAVQNPEGWSDLNKKDDTANTGAAAGAPAADASAPTEAVDAVPDDLWSDFEAAATQKKDIEANRNAEIEKREKEIAEAEQKVKNEQAQKEKEEQEKIQKQKDEEEAKIRAEEEEREKARAAARAELQAETKQTINIEEQREAMKEFGGEGMVSGMEKHAAQIKETLGNGSNGEQA